MALRVGSLLRSPLLSPRRPRAVPSDSVFKDTDDTNCVIQERPGVRPSATLGAIKMRWKEPGKELVPVTRGTACPRHRNLAPDTGSGHAALRGGQSSERDGPGRGPPVLVGLPPQPRGGRGQAASIVWFKGKGEVSTGPWVHQGGRWLGTVLEQGGVGTVAEHTLSWGRRAGPAGGDATCFRPQQAAGQDPVMGKEGDHRAGRSSQEGRPPGRRWRWALAKGIEGTSIILK